MAILQNDIKDLPYDTVILPLGIYQSKLKLYIKEIPCLLVCLLWYYSQPQNMQLTYLSIQEWMRKNNVVHKHNGLYLKHRMSSRYGGAHP